MDELTNFNDQYRKNLKERAGGKSCTFWGLFLNSKPYSYFQERAGGESCMPGTELELGENIVDSYGKVSHRLLAAYSI